MCKYSVLFLLFLFLSSAAAHAAIFGQVHGVEQFLVVVFVEAPYVDSQFFQQPNRLLAVIARRLDGLGSTVSEE